MNCMVLGCLAPLLISSPHPVPGYLLISQLQWASQLLAEQLHAGDVLDLNKGA